jgi:threonine aldolase
MLAGPKDFVREARRARKLLGGGMRQAGVLAAAGLCALRDPPDLRADHARAAALARVLREIPGLSVAEPETNIVVVGLERKAPADVLEALKGEGVLAVAFGPRRIRLVTHRDVGDADVERAAAAMARIMGTT